LHKEIITERQFTSWNDCFEKVAALVLGQVDNAGSDVCYGTLSN